MNKRIGETLLWLFVVMVGLQLGGGIYEARVVVPRWSNPPQPAEVAPALERSGHAAAGPRFWVFVSPPVTLLALANALAAFRAQGRRRRPWWLGSAVAVFLGSLITYAFFIPTLEELSRAESTPEAEELASNWARLNHLRLAAGFGAWLAALRALSLPDENRG
jgi:hypothetical protein